MSLCVEDAPAQLPDGVTEIVLGSLPRRRGSTPRCRSAPRRPASSATGTAHRLDGVPLALQAPRPE